MGFLTIENINVFNKSNNSYGSNFRELNLYNDYAVELANVGYKINETIKYPIDVSYLYIYYMHKLSTLSNGRDRELDIVKTMFFKALLEEITILQSMRMVDDVEIPHLIDRIGEICYSASELEAVTDLQEALEYDLELADRKDSILYGVVDIFITLLNNTFTNGINTYPFNWKADNSNIILTIFNSDEIDKYVKDSYDD